MIKLNLVSFLIFLFAAVPAFAESSAKSEVVKVRVREIHGSGMAESGKGAAPVSKELNDLKKKLKQLNYQEYKLVDTRDQNVVMQKKTNIGLGDGHVLTVKPLYLKPSESSNRIGMWIHWADKSGMEILDTRMHFSCGESMITGMEHSDTHGRILAIDVSPVE